MTIQLRIATVRLLACLVLAATIAACGTEQEVLVTAPATRTPRPTFTSTPRPTETFTPSPTTPPTDTPTPTVPPPTLTFTPSPTIPPTETPTPRPTATRRPPPPPQPTATPAPTNTPLPPFTLDYVRGIMKCDEAGVTGFAYHFNKAPYPGVAVGVWSDMWDGAVGISESNGKFWIDLTHLPRDVPYYAAVVDLATCNQGGGQPTAKSCRLLSPVKGVSSTTKCSGTGANNLTELVARGP